MRFCWMLVRCQPGFENARKGFRNFDLQGFVLCVLKRRGEVPLAGIIGPEFYTLAVPVKVRVHHFPETKVVITALPLVQVPTVCARSGAKHAAKAAQVVNKVMAVVMWSVALREVQLMAQFADGRDLRNSLGGRSHRWVRREERRAI